MTAPNVPDVTASQLFIMGFQFRLRFHLQPTVHINSELEEICIVSSGNECTIKLKGRVDEPIKNTDRLAIIGGPYASEEDAIKAANQARTSLLLWATKERMGIDLGSDYRASYIFEHGLKMLEAQQNMPVRNDIHGIDIYEASGKIRFAKADASFKLGKNPETLKTYFQRSFTKDIKYSDRLLLACELFCAAFFDLGFRSRFITLVTAVEALLEPIKREPEELMLVQSFVESVESAGLPTTASQSLLGSLKWLENLSIGQTGRILAQRLLANSKYADKEAGKFFSDCYNTRSSIVHSGTCKLSMTELADLANLCMQFVGDLLVELIREETEAYSS